MTTNVYVLELVEGKYYVGCSKNVFLRYQQHTSGTGAAWTKKYPPVRIIEVFNNVDEFEENNVTKKYMMRYGIDNVRGGSYCTFILPSEEIVVITKEIRSSQGCCVRCGRKGHFITNCYSNADVDGTSLEESIINIDSTLNVKLHCTRCGRNNHNVDKCYAKSTLTGLSLNNNFHHSTITLNTDSNVLQLYSIDNLSLLENIKNISDSRLPFVICCAVTVMSVVVLVVLVVAKS